MKGCAPGVEDGRKRSGDLDPLQPCNQLAQQRTKPSQFGAMGGGERGQERLAMRRERNAHLTPVRRSGTALDEPLFDETVDLAGRAMGAQHQPLGKLAHKHSAARGANGEQSLVLLRRDPGLRGFILAEAREPSQFVPDGGQGSVVVVLEILAHNFPLRIAGIPNQKKCLRHDVRYSAPPAQQKFKRTVAPAPCSG